MNDHESGDEPEQAEMKTEPLLIEHRDVEPNLCVFCLSGKLMLGMESAQLGSMVPERIAAGRKHFIFDLSGVSHIDSTGIGRFIDAFSKIGKVGGQLRLAGATGAVREAFRVTRLDTVFKFFPDVESACQGLS